MALTKAEKVGLIARGIVRLGEGAKNAGETDLEFIQRIANAEVLEHKKTYLENVLNIQRNFENPNARESVDDIVN